VRTHDVPLSKLAWLPFVFCITYAFGVAAEGTPPADMVPDQCIVVFYDNTLNLRHGALMGD
jgi:hypothetical protein